MAKAKYKKKTSSFEFFPYFLSQKVNNRITYEIHNGLRESHKLEKC